MVGSAWHMNRNQAVLGSNDDSFVPSRFEAAPDLVVSFSMEPHATKDSAQMQHPPKDNPYHYASCCLSSKRLLVVL